MNSSRTKILRNLKEKPFSKLVKENIDKPNPEKVNTNVYKTIDDTLINVFKNELEAVDGEVVVCKNKKELDDALQLFIKENNLQNIYTFIPDYLQLFKDKGYNVSKKFNDKIDVSITACEYLSARTGTVIVSSKVTGRRINIFAPVHIIVAKESQLVKDIDEGIDKLTNKYKFLPSAISYITGPSRTADIEKTLIIGAHGPKNLIVFIEENN
jgi:L-lactate dehydrogenase complex protein LldG